MEDEVCDHLARGRRSLKAAELLAEEGLYEDASSRCYYAMYHAAKAALAREGVKTRTHKGLISMYGRHFVKDGRLDKESLRNLSYGFGLRMSGDYDPSYSLTEEEITSLLVEAREFITSVETFLNQ